MVDMSREDMEHRQAGLAESSCSAAHGRLGV
jgi:hypothetical protein